MIIFSISGPNQFWSTQDKSKLERMFFERKKTIFFLLSVYKTGQENREIQRSFAIIE